MLERKKVWKSALAAAVIAFLVAKSDDVTKFFAAWTFAFGAMSINQVGVVMGIVLGVATYFTGLYFKIKNHRLLKEAIEKGVNVDAILKDEDQS